MEGSVSSNRFRNIVYALLICIAVVIILVYGKDVIIPFVMAILFWFIIKEVKRFIRMIKIGKSSLPEWLLNIVAFAVIFGLTAMVVKMITYNINQFSEVLPSYRDHILVMMTQLNDTFGIDIESRLKEISFEATDLSGILKQVLDSLTALFGNAFMVVLYVLFLMLEEAVFPKKLDALYRNNPEKRDRSNKLMGRLSESISKYFFLKTVVSLITGVCSYVALIIIGVDFAFLWAFLIFLLNYIPTIGSLIATLLPVLIALVQFDTLTPALIVLVVIGGIQVAVGNVLEPRIMGNSLNISSLAVILALSFWGAIWGVVGMILCVPITVMIVIIFSQFSTTRSIAIFLSDKGNVDELSEE